MYLPDETVLSRKVKTTCLGNCLTSLPNVTWPHIGYIPGRQRWSRPHQPALSPKLSLCGDGDRVEPQAPQCSKVSLCGNGLDPQPSYPSQSHALCPQMHR